MLTKDELTAYMARRQRCGEFVREVLRDVGGSGAFFEDSAKVYVQMYQSKNGGCEMFVTRLENRGVKFRMKAEEETMKYRPRQPEYQVCGVCRFDALSGLITACARLSSFDTGESSAYSDDSGLYYLVCARSFPELQAICGEYGGECCDGSVCLHISERCRCLCEKDAVGILSKLS